MKPPTCHLKSRTIMSNFWSLWIIGLTTLTIVGVTWVLFANRTFDKKEGEQTTGHIYDGIEEYDNPLPAWWFNLFVASVIFAIGYLALYPGMGKFSGFLGWTSTNQWQEEVSEAEAEFNERAKAYMAMPAAELAGSREALKMGGRIFKTYCTVCHGTDAKGGYAFPNLTDNDWLYGGTEADIKNTISNGRKGMMPAWEAVLGDKVDSMADYVIKLGNEDVSAHPMHAQFQALCSACHSPEGTGNQMIGAPNLTDDIWLYGGSKSEVKLTIAKGRNGNMPAHKGLLSEERIHLLTGYILSLGQK